MRNELVQPAALRWALFANIMLWGVRIPGLHLMITLAAGFLISTPRRGVSLSFMLYSFTFLAYGLITFLAGPCVDGGVKVLGSLLVMLLLLIALYRLASSALHDRPLLTLAQASTLLAIITAAAVLEFLIRMLGGASLGELRVGGLYLEPSHLALSSTPLVCYLFLCGRPSHKIGGLVSAGILLAVGFSSTLLVLLVILLGLPRLGQMVSQPGRLSGVVVFALLAAAPGLFLLSSASQDTLLRVTDIVDLRQESNLSSLVYANGWMLLGQYLDNTRGFGLGFNAMGCNPQALTVVNDWLELLNLGNQNYNDGSFLLSKLGSEFGFAGIALFALMALLVLKKIFGLSKRHADPTTVLCVAWLAIVFIGGVIRSGGGYFTGPVILGVLAFLLLREKRKASKNPAAASTPAPGPEAPGFAHPSNNTACYSSKQ